MIVYKIRSVDAATGCARNCGALVEPAWMRFWDPVRSAPICTLCASLEITMERPAVDTMPALFEALDALIYQADLVEHAGVIMATNRLLELFQPFVAGVLNEDAPREW